MNTDWDAILEKARLDLHKQIDIMAKHCKERDEFWFYWKRYGIVLQHNFYLRHE